MFSLIKSLAFFLFLSIFSVSFGQQFSYPVIKKQGRIVADFVPAGWEIKDSIIGDLNNDKHEDIVVVLQQKKHITISRRKSRNIEKITTKPRILLILFQKISTNTLELQERSNTFILSQEDSQMTDPYQSMKIENEKLYFNFTIYYGPSAYSMQSYTFRYQNKEFFLIGATSNYFNEATRDMSDYSFNFLAKKWSIIEGNDDTNQKQKKIWHTLNLKNLKTLKTFQEPNSWEVTKDIYL
jgi:hypothetical protein